MRHHQCLSVSKGCKPILTWAMTECSESETLAALLERAWNNALVSDNLFRSPGPTCYLSDSKDQHEGVTVSLSFNAVQCCQMNSRLICMVRTKLGEKQTPKSGAPMHFQNLHLLILYSSVLHACLGNFCVEKFERKS